MMHSMLLALGLLSLAQSGSSLQFSIRIDDGPTVVLCDGRAGDDTNAATAPK